MKKKDAEIFTRLRDNELKNIKEQKKTKKKMNKTIMKMWVVIFLGYYFL